jgi:hypothetical protein
MDLGLDRRLAELRVAELEATIRAQKLEIQALREDNDEKEAKTKTKTKPEREHVCSGCAALLDDMKRAWLEARDVAASLGQVQRLPPDQQVMGNVQFLTGELSNLYFQQRRNAAHWEEQAAMLRAENDVLQQLCECAKDLFAAAEAFHSELKLHGLDAAAERLQMAFAKCALFEAFQASSRGPVAELGTTLVAKLSEDANCVLPDLVRWAETFVVRPCVERNDALTYCARNQQLEAHLVAFLKDYPRQATATLCFRKLAQEFSLASHTSQNARARELLQGQPHEVWTRVFGPKVPDEPELKYPVVYGAPRSAIREALLHVAQEHRLDLEPRLLDPDGWPSLDPLFPLTHFIADFIQEFDWLKPKVFELDARVATEVSRFGRVDECEDGSYRYSLASCYLARAVCVCSDNE